ncbi:hypothetical protein ABZX64_09200 [Streptomyces misionensis]|uniref:hypothetical protein n=1 Tax=Streptomyces misionensis TaxID=67331 RepID=UPI0033B8A9FC
MLDGKYSDDTGKQLCSAVAEALLPAGWTSYDNGLHGIAQRYFLRAPRMPQAAGDRPLGGKLGQRTPESDPPYIAYFDEVELATEIGHCFRVLGRSAEAAERGAVEGLSIEL